MKYCAVADMTIFLDDHVSARKAVKHAAVLDVRSSLHVHSAEVASEAGQWSHVASGLHHDIANKDGVRMDESGGIDDRNYTFN
jgi:hypothetical protein